MIGVVVGVWWGGGADSYHHDSCHYIFVSC